MLNEQKIYLFVLLGGQPYSDTSSYGECSLIKSKQQKVSSEYIFSSQLY